eukprot:6007676-Pleurochrysis_carterae.AAC.1
MGRGAGPPRRARRGRLPAANAPPPDLRERRRGMDATQPQMPIARPHRARSFCSRGTGARGLRRPRNCAHAAS